MIILALPAKMKLIQINKIAVAVLAMSLANLVYLTQQNICQKNSKYASAKITTNYMELHLQNLFVIWRRLMWWSFCNR